MRHHLCHKDKVIIRKAYRALVENDKNWNCGLNDPITEYYGGGASEAVNWAFSHRESRIVKAALKSRMISRGYVPVRDRIFDLVKKFRLFKVKEERDDGVLEDPNEQYYGIGGYEGGAS